ncbi:MAG: glycosyltransferase, partial [Hyphomicrobiales bacterium]|nr:glycosyltransferase [Hyphomicrobiales bacterium]
GSGPDEAAFRRLAKELGLEKTVKFAGAMPARLAFSRGRCLIVPSRAESFPYIVLEAAAAQLPMILTDVGGIPEIVDGTEIELCQPGDEVLLEAQMSRFLNDPDIFVQQAKSLQTAVAENFTATGMAQAIIEVYERALDLAGRT